MDALGLVREASRLSGFNMEPYNDALVRKASGSLKRLFSDAAQFSKIQEQYDPSSPLDVGINADDFKLLLMQNEIVRNKRCLIVYHKARLEHLAKMTIGLPCFPANVRPHLSKAENEFQLEYAASLSRIAASYGNIVTLNGPLHPPKDLYITVRVIKDCGVVQTEYGPLYLNSNSFHYVRKSDVEHLIAQGFLIQT